MKSKPLNRTGVRQLLGIYRFVLPYKHHFLAGLICLFISSSVLLAFPELSGALIDTASGKRIKVLDLVEFRSISQIILTLFAILSLQTIFSFFRVYFFAKVSEPAMADIRQAMYQKLTALPMSFFDTRRTGELTSRITADVTLLQDTFSIVLAQFVREILTLLFGITILFVKTPKLTFFMLAIVPILALAALFFGRFIRKLSKQKQDKLAEANVIVEETLQAIGTVKSFTNENYEAQRYKNALESMVIFALKSANYRGLFISFIIFAMLGAITAVLWFGTVLVQEGSLQVGELVSFVLYTIFIAGSIGGLGNSYGQIQSAIGASERISELLEISDELDKNLENKSLIRRNGLKLSGNVVFKNIQFSYPTRKEVEVLKGVSFELKQGRKIALVGESGAGKSTIIQLLLRLYESDSGEIQVDRNNILNFDLKDYRANIGIVPQEVLLFGGTITENIRYGKPDATFEEIEAAARKANALKFIEQFPDKFETIVGERGVKLSGGQRQRIAIARAILKNPAILVLDEATSSLDAESEFLVQEALEKLMKNRSTIIIAHRLATVREADCIYVLEKGQITELGTHEELIRIPDGTYQNLIQLQMMD